MEQKDRVISERAVLVGLNADCFKPEETATYETMDELEALLETYLDRGGFEVQVNTVDRATLADAQTHPERHGDLVVRIGGYSDYFTKIGKNMQDEIILRTEHGM